MSCRHETGSPHYPISRAVLDRPIGCALALGRHQRPPRHDGEAATARPGPRSQKRRRRIRHRTPRRQTAPSVGWPAGPCFAPSNCRVPRASAPRRDRSPLPGLRRHATACSAGHHGYPRKTLRSAAAIKSSAATTPAPHPTPRTGGSTLHSSAHKRPRPIRLAVSVAGEVRCSRRCRPNRLMDVGSSTTGPARAALATPDSPAVLGSRIFERWRDPRRASCPGRNR